MKKIELTTPQYWTLLLGGALLLGTTVAPMIGGGLAGFGVGIAWWGALALTTNQGHRR